MRVVTLATPDDFEGWRDAARRLAAQDVPPEAVLWRVGAERGDLFGAESDADEPARPAAARFSVPRAFLDLARSAVLASDPERFSLLYAALTRLRHQPQLLDDAADPLVRRLERLAKEVRRDLHKMHAFVRFRELVDRGETRFVAWFEPEHHIVRAAAPFFVRRFPNMAWSILTPDLSLHWDGTRLCEGPGAARGDAPADDPIESVWKTYYASTFNPARLKIGAMLKEMPKKYWKNMPETALVGALTKGAQARETEMVTRSAAQLGDNALKAWESVRAEALRCTRCPLHACATQTVFGEGLLDARIVFVGEQPGDQEDLAGRPFVGPAGQLFDRALAEAGIDRARTYVTNAVKHFKFVQRGKRRIHDKPGAGEISACRWWLQQELGLIRPQLTVALGATAVRALFGKALSVSPLRGDAQRLADGSEAWVTVHPSFLLRVRDDREAEYARFVADLANIGQRAETLSASPAA